MKCISIDACCTRFSICMLYKGFPWIMIDLRKWIQICRDQIIVGCWHWNALLTLANQRVLKTSKIWSCYGHHYHTRNRGFGLEIRFLLGPKSSNIGLAFEVRHLTFSPNPQMMHANCLTGFFWKKKSWLIPRLHSCGYSFYVNINILKFYGSLMRRLEMSFAWAPNMGSWSLKEVTEIQGT